MSGDAAQPSVTKVQAGQEIQVSVVGMFATEHRLEGVAGRLGVLSFRPFGRACTFRTPEGEEWVARRTHWWRGTHELRHDERVLARARPVGWFRRELEVKCGGWTGRLEPTGRWTRSWRLVDKAGAPLLEVRGRGLFRRGACIRILAETDLAVLVFAYYLVWTRWQEGAAAAAAAA